MRFGTKKIIDVAHDLIQKNEIKEDAAYQWIDIVGIPQRPKSLKAVSYTHLTLPTNREV